jgi:hypothetical protein
MDFVARIEHGPCHALDRRVRVFALSCAILVIGCSGAAEVEDDEPVGTTSAELVASDPVSSAVSQSCSTTAVKGLATQLVEEIQCLKPGSMKDISGTPGLSLGAAVFPFLQTSAANALIDARKARGTTMTINSGLRTLAQQYLLYRWYQTGRCGIGLAAKPGTSNHESALAVDIEDNAGWRSAMNGHSFRWLGASDPVHYDYIGGGTIDLRGLSVKAFQRLWNRNHPADTIAEDGAYGPATETRLAQAPVGGFAMGAFCKNADAGAEGGATTPQSSEPTSPPEPVPDATEPGSATTDSTSITPVSRPIQEVADGCALAPRSAMGSGPLLMGLAGLALGLRARRRRASRATTGAMRA